MVVVGLYQVDLLMLVKLQNTQLKRELQEETLAKLDDIKKIEPLGVFKTNDPREIDFYAYPFVFHMTNSAELKFADDAKNGKWVLLSRAIKMDLAFTHHNEFLKKIYY